MMKPIRARGIVISLEFLRAALGLPEDCEIKWIGMGESPWYANARIESEQFPEIPAHEEIPRCQALFELVDGKPKFKAWA